MLQAVSATPSTDGNTPEISPAPEDDLWDGFWTLFPRHEAKKDARRAWDRLSPSVQMDAVVAIAAWRRVWQAQGRTTQVIPLPATWLNGERWEDEIPAQFSVRPQSHAPAAPLNGKVNGAVAMPDHVRAAIAKLKAGK
jgi:hypothetical protein